MNPDKEEEKEKALEEMQMFLGGVESIIETAQRQRKVIGTVAQMILDAMQTDIDTKTWKMLATIVEPIRQEMEKVAKEEPLTRESLKSKISH